MNASRRVLTLICVSLALLLIVVVRFESKTAAAIDDSRNESASKPVSSSPLRMLWQTPAAQQPATKEKTIGETHKNIKVLNDLPDSQLIPMMNLIAGSLGVRCNFCHVNKNGQWDYPNDEKPEKATAREMITMTLNINKVAFKGNSEVSCFTCHRGRTNPARVIELPIPQPTPRPSPSAATTGPIPAPTSDEILAKYTAAIGGQTAIDKLKTRVMKGTYALQNGSTGNYEVTQVAPDNFYVLRTSPQGNSEQAFNGTEGWQKDGRGVSEIRPDQLAELKSEYQFFRDLNIKGQYTRKNIRRDQVNGRDVFVITGTLPDKSRERLFFDAETGLLVRRMGLIETPLGVLPAQTDYEDYREVDGVKVPFTVKLYVVGGFFTATRKFTEIKFNVPVENSRFAKPAAAKP